MPIKNIIKGDSIEFQCTVDESITGWKIRSEIYDNNSSIKKATANSGGSDDQIEITNASGGIFLIKIDAAETTSFTDLANIEIEVTTAANKIYTIYQDTITFLSQKITWSTP